MTTIKTPQELTEALTAAWNDFMDATTSAVQQQIEFDRQATKWFASNARSPFSDTPDGFRMQKSIQESRASARESLDNYIRWSK